MAAATPPVTSQVESSATGSASSGVSPKMRYARFETTNGEAEQVELVRRAGALDRSADEVTGTANRSTTPTAAAALRVVRLETAMEAR